MLKNNILVVRFKFLSLTETFTYDELIYLKKYRPYVFCRQRFNESIFPYDLVCDSPFSVKNKVLRIYDDYFRPKMSKRRRERLELEYLKDFIQKNNITIVHAHFFDEMLFCMDLKKKVKLSLVVSLHGGKDLQRMRKLGPDRINELSQEVDFFIVKAVYMKQELVDMGIDCQRIVVFSRGIDLDKWLIPAEKENLDKVSIFFGGRCIENKGIIDLLGAAKKLDCEFIVIGYADSLINRLLGFTVNFLRYFKVETDYIYPEIIRLFIMVKGLKNVRFIPGLTNDRFKKIMAKFDIVVVPSKGSAQEGIPRVLIEAQALGKPVIASDQPGLERG